MINVLFCFFTNNFCNKITKTATIHFFNLRFLFITSKSLMCKWSMFETMKKKPLDFHLSYPGTDQLHRYITLSALAIFSQDVSSHRLWVSSKLQLVLCYLLPLPLLARFWLNAQCMWSPILRRRVWRVWCPVAPTVVFSVARGTRVWASVRDSSPAPHWLPRVSLCRRGY